MRRRDLREKKPKLAIFAKFRVRIKFWKNVDSRPWVVRFPRSAPIPVWRVPECLGINLFDLILGLRNVLAALQLGAEETSNKWLSS